MCGHNKAKSGNLNLFLRILLFFSPYFPVFYKRKVANCPEKGLDYQILPYIKRKFSFSLRNRLRFRCGLELRVTLRPKSLAICGRGWKATMYTHTQSECVCVDEHPRTQLSTQQIFFSSSLVGVVSEGVFTESLRNFCGEFAETCKKYVLLRQERVQKFCGNFTEICGIFSAMTPSRTTP